MSVSFEQVLCFPLQSIFPPWPDNKPLNAKITGCIPSPVNPALLAASLPHQGASWRKPVRAPPIPLCALTECSTHQTLRACLLPPCQGWQEHLRRRRDMPRPRQAFFASQEFFASQPLMHYLKTSCWQPCFAQFWEGCFSATALA